MGFIEAFLLTVCQSVMRLLVSNITNLLRVRMDIDGISIISGKTGTGKTNFCKTIFSSLAALNSFEAWDKIAHFEQIRAHILDAKIDSTHHSLDLCEIVDSSDILEKIYESIKQAGSNLRAQATAVSRELYSFLSEYAIVIDSNLLKDLSEGIVSDLSVLSDKRKCDHIENTLNHALAKSILNPFHPQDGSIIYEFDDYKGNIAFSAKPTPHGFGSVRGIKQIATAPFNHPVIYIDDPNIIDVLGSHNDYDEFLNDESRALHHKQLLNLLRSPKQDRTYQGDILFQYRFEILLGALSYLCDGVLKSKNPPHNYYGIGDDSKESLSERLMSMTSHDTGFSHRLSDAKAYREYIKSRQIPSDLRFMPRRGFTNKLASHGYELNTLSSGVKLLLILKLLIFKHVLPINGLLIIDKPEAYLNTEWQFIFAELLVVLNRFYGLKTVLITNSLVLIRSIDLYADKYEVSDVCRYYLAHHVDPTLPNQKDTAQTAASSSGTSNDSVQSASASSASAPNASSATAAKAASVNQDAEVSSHDSSYASSNASSNVHASTESSSHLHDAQGIASHDSANNIHGSATNDAVKGNAQQQSEKSQDEHAPKLPRELLLCQIDNVSSQSLIHMMFEHLMRPLYQVFDLENENDQRFSALEPPSEEQPATEDAESGAQDIAADYASGSVTSENGASNTTASSNEASSSGSYPSWAQQQTDSNKAAAQTLASATPSNSNSKRNDAHDPAGKAATHDGSNGHKHDDSFINELNELGDVPSWEMEVKIHDDL